MGLYTDRVLSFFPYRLEFDINEGVGTFIRYLLDGEDPQIAFDVIALRFFKRTDNLLYSPRDGADLRETCPTSSCLRESLVVINIDTNTLVGYPREERLIPLVVKLHYQLLLVQMDLVLISILQSQSSLLEVN